MRIHASIAGWLVALLVSMSYGGVPERFERASEPIVTPHVAWAKPLPGGPLRVLALVPIPSQRDVIELAQRLEMQYDLVTFQDPLLHADVAEQFHKLLADKPYDLVLLSKVPLARLPEATQTLLVDKVRRGTGLVNVHASATLRTGELIHGSQSGAWLEAGLPLDLLPQGCRPEAKTGQCGEGRTVSLSYKARVTCLTPKVGFGEANARDWETYYQLLSRAALWAARRATGVEIDLVWPSATVERRTQTPWRTEQVVHTRHPRLVRESGTWQIEASEEKAPLPTWCGYGATVGEANGKLAIKETNLDGSSGFAAGKFRVDLAQTPILAVTVEQAKTWSLFVADARFERPRAVLQAATSETGAKRYDLRQFPELAGQEPLVLCFATAGEGTSLVLGGLEFLTAEGKPVAVEAPSPSTPEAAEVLLRLRSTRDAPAVVEATYRGPDYYQPLERRQSPVALRKDAPVEVRFPLLDLGGNQPHVVDLVVRDDQGRSLAFATASYRVESPVVLASWTAEQDFGRRGDRVRLVAKFDNRAAPRDVQLAVRLSDMHGRLIAVLDEKLSIPAGTSEHGVALPTDHSLTTLNLARLRVDDARGRLLEADAHVYLPEANPAWDDYLVSTSQFGNTSPYLRPYAMQFARDMGIEGAVIPLHYTIEALQQAAPVMFWGAADVRAFGYNFHGEEASTARIPCLSNPATRSKISESYEKLGRTLRQYGPMALASLEDESELSGARYCNLEVCTSEHCTRRYRGWLKEQYGSIEALNRQWDASYASFDAVEPITYKEARQLANPARWVDWRTFMEYVWLDGLLLTRQGVKKHSPEMRMGFSNSFGQMPFSGWNFETLSRNVDMTIEYPTVIFRLAPPKGKDPFEDDAVAMSTVIRQKLDIRRSFMTDAAPSPGWLWYDRSEQGAEFKPWWMAFLGAKGCTPWGADSLGVRQGAKQMAFWAFVHPQLAHTKGSTWLASGLHDLTHGVGKLFVDYSRTAAPVAVLYSQPSMHLAWAWSDVESAFEPPTTSLYAWYYKSRVNVTRLLRELGFTYRYVGTSQIDVGELKKYQVLFLPCSLCLSDQTLEAVRRFVDGGGTVVADLGTAAADEHGRPIPKRALVESLFGVTRQSVGRKIEPGAVAAAGPGDIAVPQGLRLAGKDAITPAAGVRIAATHQDRAPALVVRPQGKGKAVYLNGLLGYNMPSRLLVRSLLASAGLSTPVRVTSGGREQMGYEWTTFRRGDLELVGLLRLRDETNPTLVKLGQPKHLYDVRGKRYLGLVDAAEFDLTHQAAAVLAVLPYAINGVDLQAAPAQVAPGEAVAITARVRGGVSPGDHVLRLEVYDPAGRLSRAYTDNVLAVAGQFERSLHTALNDAPGRWRVVVTEVISGQKAEAAFTVAASNPQ